MIVFDQAGRPIEPPHNRALELFWLFGRMPAAGTTAAATLERLARERNVPIRELMREGRVPMYDAWLNT